MLKETVYSPQSELSNFKILISGIFRGFVDGKGLARAVVCPKQKSDVSSICFWISVGFFTTHSNSCYLDIFER